MLELKKNYSLPGVLSLAFSVVAVSGGYSHTADAAEGSVRVLEEIIVTARKKEESLQDAPVLINAFSKQQIKQQRIAGLDDLAQFTPGLQTSEQTSSNGGSVFLRGIGTGNASGLSDSSVAINIDGMQVSSNNIRKVSQIDMQQIEILRGPQALFFGKNSPAGVISIRTADPGGEFEVESTAGYETVSGDKYIRGIVSGPVSDTVGIRLVGQFTDVDGYFNLRTVDGAGGDNLLFQPASISKWPQGEESYLRATIVADPSDQLHVRAKLHYSKADIRGGSSTALQRIDCPTGMPRGNQVDFPCNRNLGRDVYIGGAAQSVVDLEPTALSDAIGFRENTQYLGTLELNYEFDSGLEFTSVTGYWDLAEDNAQNASAGVVADTLVPAAIFTTEQLTQEFRLASSYDSAVNFTLGAFGEWRDSTESITAIVFNPVVFGPNPFPFGIGLYEEEQQALSAFGQVEVDLSDQWILAAGARYSYEEKDLRVFGGVRDVTGNLRIDNDSWNNLSPEVTLTFLPTDDLTLFATYKEGFKSGGIYPGSPYLVSFSRLGPGNFANGFDEEVVTGYELGAKAVLLDGTLAVNFALYTFDYDDLQVSSPTIEGGMISFRTVNAASANVDGFEADFTWLPLALDGVTVRGALAYNDSAYGTFFSACYAGQSVAAGCNLAPDDMDVLQVQEPGQEPGRAQDLGGRTLSNAPEWSGSLAVSYERELSSYLLLNASLGVTYSGSYFGDAELNPQDLQDSFSKTTASISLGSIDERWEISIVGRNLTDKFTFSTTAPATAAGGGGVGAGTEAATVGDLTGFPSKGREIFLAATYRWK